MNTRLNNKSKSGFFLLTLLPLLLGGCAAPRTPSSAEIEKVYFYDKPTKQYTKQKIDRYFETTLFDPYTAKIKCAAPSDKAWFQDNRYTQRHYGYLVHCTINAKNRLGGYTGFKDRWFLFNGSEFFSYKTPAFSGLLP